MSIENEQSINENINMYAGEDTTKDKYLTFEVNEEDYGVEIIYIKEIISVCAITRVPHMPSYVKGIINLRGDIIPVIDVRERFMIPPKEYDELTCIVVIENSGYILGLIVDNVKEVTFIDETNVVNTPSAKLKYHNQFIRNIGKTGTEENEEVVLLLNLEKVLME